MKRVSNDWSFTPEDLKLIASDAFAKDAYNFYVKELRPLGYKLHAEIISFPGGMPGDVGLYLAW